jgi:hypothetical protein
MGRTDLYRFSGTSFTPYRLQRPPLNFAIYVQASMSPTLRPASRASLLQGFNPRLCPSESAYHLTVHQKESLSAETR